MLTIHKPEVVITQDKAMLSARIECDGTVRNFWFSTQPEYGQYLCSERADAFLVTCMLYAMHQQHDITVLAPISARLYYSMTNYLIPTLHKRFPELKHIAISCEEIDTTPLPNAGAVGTAISCGIDSLYTIAQHTADDCVDGYRLSHLTFFNAGSHGNNKEQRSPRLFQQRLAQAMPLVNELRLPLVIIESNAIDIVEMPHQSMHTYVNTSCILALQKLFKTYYYSSGFNVFDFQFTLKDPALYDIFSLPLLSTEQLSFFSAGATESRVEKTQRVIKYTPSYRVLNVCTETVDNCSACPKCLRTLLALDALGALERYAGVFNLDVYRRVKNTYLATVLYDKHVDIFCKEIKALIRQQHYAVPAGLYLRYQYSLVRKFLTRFGLLRAMYRTVRKHKKVALIHSYSK